MFLWLSGVLILLIYIFIKYHYAYWKRKGVPGPEPTILFGNLSGSFLQKTSYGEDLHKIYTDYPNERIVGLYRATTPSLLIRDPELIKEFAIRSFEHFMDNDMAVVDKKLDPIVGRSPFFLNGDEWKKMRAPLVPPYSSGKIKKGFPLLQTVSKNMVKFIETNGINKNPEGYEAKELSIRFTLNNVATFAFGIDGKCFEEENSEFRDLSRRFLVPGGIVAIKVLLVLLFPFLSKVISIKFIPKDVEDQLLSIVKDTLKFREDNNVVREDFLNSMHELKKTLKDFDDVDVTAQAAGFFGDGSETSSIVLSFILYELAANQNAQTKARQEIEKKWGSGELTYEALQEMTYLEACIYESIRMHAPLYNGQKLCTKSYEYVPKWESESVKKPFIIEKGTSIIIPIHGVQNDPKYFQEPEKYRPERFDEEKASLDKSTFLAFGQGPRVCIGQRFGILQLKVGLAYLLKNYKLTVNSKTQLPFKYDPKHFLISPVGGIWLNFEKN